MIDEPSVFRPATPHRPCLPAGTAHAPLAWDEDPEDVDLRECLKSGLGAWFERAIRRTFLYSFDG